MFSRLLGAADKNDADVVVCGCREFVEKDCVVCNGELYGFRFEKEILKRRGYKFQSDCDCEILLPLY